MALISVCAIARSGMSGSLGYRAVIAIRNRVVIIAIPVTARMVPQATPTETGLRHIRCVPVPRHGINSAFHTFVVIGVRPVREGAAEALALSAVRRVALGVLTRKSILALAPLL
jgi:hypothetical protein